MGYLGNSPQNQAFTPRVDYFSGNASATAFTLSFPVASVAQVQAVIENVPQNPGDAYTVSGNTITFTSAPPSGTNNIYVYYTSPITQVIQPGQGTVGTAQLVDGAVTSAKLAAGAALSNLGTSQLADANMPAGSVLQVVSTTKTDTFSTTSTSLVDVTGLSLSITPSSASNKILVTCAVSVGTPNTNFAYINLVRGSTSLCVGDASAGRPSATGMSFAGVSNEGNITTLPINFLDSPSSTSALTYKIQIRCATAGNAYINRSSRDSASTDYDVRLASTITVMEIAG